MTYEITGLMLMLSAAVFAAPGDAGWTRPATCSHPVFKWDGKVDAHPAWTYTTSSAGNWRWFYSGNASVGSWESAGALGLWVQTFVSTNAAPTPAILQADYISHINATDESGNCMTFKVAGNDPETDPLTSRYQMSFNYDDSFDKNEGYLRYNLKLPENHGKAYPAGTSDWMLMAEWRYVGEYKFRMGLYLSYGTIPAEGIEDDFFYKVQIEQNIDGVKTYPLKEFYYTTAENFTPGDYLEYEFYYKYDEAQGALWINIGGKELCKYTHINTRPQGITPVALHCPKVYTSKKAIRRGREADATCSQTVNFMEIYTD